MPHLCGGANMSILRQASMKIQPLPYLLAAILFLPGASGASPADSDQIRRPSSPPYKGDLSVLDDPRRDQNLQIDRVMHLLGIQRGSDVADIGAGGGWFSVRAARRVGPAGTVYAIDINPTYVKSIAARARRENLPNVQAILSRPDDPLLPRASINAALLLKTYHEIAQPIRLLGHVRAAMRPGARLGIIDRTGNGSDHGLDEKTVIQELGRAGFSFIAKYDFVKADGDDYFLLFR